MDLNIIVYADKKRDSQQLVLSKVKTAHKLGFKAIALSVYIGAGEVSNIPEPPVIEFGPGNEVDMKVYTRLTVAVDDPMQPHKLIQSPVLRKYDILAIEPLNEKMMNHICGGNFDCDIVCFAMGERMLVNLKKVNLNIPKTRGIAFEINYSEALFNQTNRQNVITSGQLLVEKLRGKNIIFSSGARIAIALRSDYDVANLGLLFGLKENQAKEAVFRIGYSVLKHSEARRNVNSNVVAASTTLERDDKWLANEFNIDMKASEIKVEQVEEPSRKKVKVDV